MDIHSFGEIIIWPWGHENSETSNDEGLETLMYKYGHFNDYDPSGPNNGFSYPASGVTDDWAYGVLGASSSTLELGTSFYQNCNYFESNILNGNLGSLTYASKVAKAPYSIAKGPDVVSVTLSSNIIENKVESSLTVTAQVSDNAFSSGTYTTNQQTISSARLYIDTHPYDLINGVPSNGIAMNGIFDSVTVTVDITLSMSDILSEIDFVVGRHTIHLIGTDSNGYDGPVTTVFFEITDTATSRPTESCNDVEGWYDEEGPYYGCSFYEQKDNCEHYGDSYENFNKTANEACCACGGGINTTTPPTPTLPPTTCQDTEGWGRACHLPNRTCGLVRLTQP